MLKETKMESSREQARRWVLRELDRHLSSAVQLLTEAQTDRQAVNLEPRCRFSATGLRLPTSGAGNSDALFLAYRGEGGLVFNLVDGRTGHPCKISQADTASS
jgi:hypothetical protein